MAQLEMGRPTAFGPKAATLAAKVTQGLIVSPAPEVVPPAASAAGARREVRALGASLIDGQWSAIEGLSIQACDCPLEIFAIAQLDKAKALRSSCHFISNHDRRGHLKSGIGYELSQRRVRRAVRQIAYEKFSRHISLSLQVGKAFEGLLR